MVFFYMNNVKFCWDVCWFVCLDKLFDEFNCEIFWVLRCIVSEIMLVWWWGLDFDVLKVMCSEVKEKIIIFCFVFF